MDTSPSNIRPKPMIKVDYADQFLFTSSLRQIPICGLLAYLTEGCHGMSSVAVGSWEVMILTMPLRWYGL